MEGNLSPPEHLRKARPVRGRTLKGHTADRFWLWAYHKLAESLAEGNLFDDAGPDTEMLMFAPGPDCSEEAMDVIDDVTAGPSASKLVLQPHYIPRHLPPLVWAEVFTIFRSWAADKYAQPCAPETLKAVYKLNWRRRLPFREGSDHTVCSQCTEYKLWRKRVSKDSLNPLRLQ